MQLDRLHVVSDLGLRLSRHLKANMTMEVACYLGARLASQPTFGGYHDHRSQSSKTMR
jgi:hypothetical protein